MIWNRKQLGRKKNIRVSDTLGYKDHEKQLEFMRAWRKRNRRYLRWYKREYRERVKFNKAKEEYIMKRAEIHQRHEKAKKIMSGL